ncbi:MAG: heme-copper oxidase subunit III [Sphingobacteriales bacterium]|nr:MAG: heme-copper oxidase subunit III [Sphingobacteriales bacterium]
MSSADQNKKIHPHKFAMWVAIASIAMMFAGLTSAYVVKQSAGTWRSFHLPVIFYISTAVILLSSLTIVLGIRAFRERKIPRYRLLINATLVLGILFGVLQFIGFYQLYSEPQAVIMNGNADGNLMPVRVDGNPSESFLFIISGLHLVHILGGIIALAIVFFKAHRKRVKVYNSVGLEIVATYWHFVDLLWLYLFVFFLANQ